MQTPNWSWTTSEIGKKNTSKTKNERFNSIPPGVIFFLSIPKKLTSAMVRSSVGKVSRFAGGANKRSKELWHSSNNLTKLGKRNTLLPLVVTLDTV